MENQINEYNRLRKEANQAEADKFATSIISIPGRSIPDRAEIWAKFKAELNAELASAKKEQNKQSKKANNTSIKKSVEAVLAYSASFNDKEIKFLNDIKTKRKLTEKQINWLHALAKRVYVEINSQIECKLSKQESTVQDSDFAYSEKEAYARFDIPVYDAENKRWYDAEY
jgi:hypothetical protein